MAKEDIEQQSVSVAIAVMAQRIEYIKESQERMESYFDSIFKKLELSVTKAECLENRRLYSNSHLREERGKNGKMLPPSRLSVALVTILGSVNVALIGTVFKILSEYRELIEKVSAE